MVYVGVDNTHFHYYWNCCCHKGKCQARLEGTAGTGAIGCKEWILAGEDKEVEHCQVLRQLLVEMG
jgi:hypothetical protein